MVTFGYIRNNELLLVPAPSPPSVALVKPTKTKGKRKAAMSAPFDVHSERLYPESSAASTTTMAADAASIAPSQAETLTPERDEMQRFTATGRPMQAYKNVGLGNMADSPLAEAPQFLPMKFTDESILHIPIPYSAIYPPEGGVKKERKSSFFGKLTGKDKTKEGFKMVKMTRKEYLMYWAKDEEGNYIGTEPEGKGREVFGDRLL